MMMGLWLIRAQSPLGVVLECPTSGWGISGDMGEV